LTTFAHNALTNVSNPWAALRRGVRGLIEQLWVESSGVTEMLRTRRFGMCVNLDAEVSGLRSELAETQQPRGPGPRHARRRPRRRRAKLHSTNRSKAQNRT